VRIRAFPGLIHLKTEVDIKLVLPNGEVRQVVLTRIDGTGVYGVLES
jgi:hypothetical protein